jgi:hypothetical protein
MRQMVGPGIEAGIRITIACVCAVVGLQLPRRVGKEFDHEP